MHVPFAQQQNFHAYALHVSPLFFCGSEIDIHHTTSYISQCKQKQKLELIHTSVEIADQWLKDTFRTWSAVDGTICCAVRKRHCSHVLCRIIMRFDLSIALSFAIKALRHLSSVNRSLMVQKNQSLPLHHKLAAMYMRDCTNAGRKRRRCNRSDRWRCLHSNNNKTLNARSQYKACSNRRR